MILILTEKELKNKELYETIWLADFVLIQDDLCGMVQRVHKSRDKEKLDVTECNQFSLADALLANLKMRK